jgi:two-component system, cell cycle sensor histidine kinase and response regulator CckA
MIASITDIHDRKRALGEEASPPASIYPAQMLNALANLSGGIAHQFNNALAGILGNVELLEMTLLENPDTDKHFKRIKSIISNMSHLTDQLLAYARGGKYLPRSICLNDMVRETLPTMYLLKKPGIEIQLRLTADIFNVNADLAQMQMALSAVVTNGVEAMGGSGQIRISTRNETVTRESARCYPGLRAGTYSSMTVEDTGKGMDKETASRIFEPFFTTKFQGRGLGMAAVYGIIKNHEGYIGVDSEPAKGTSVRILLPAFEAATSAPREPEVVRGEGNILVVEDEDMVMDVSCAMLESLGYHVLGAETGNQALEIARLFAGPIDLVLLDLGLPDIGGDALYPLLREIRPETKIMVCSGYEINNPAQAFLNAGAHGFIQKPYSMSTLSKKVRQAITGDCPLPT